MGNSKKKISDEDKALFRSWVKDARPLKKGRGTVFHHTKPKPAKINYPNEFEFEDAAYWSDPQFSEQMLSPEDRSYASKSGIQKQLFKKLKQGKLPIEARLDLHGCNIDQARIKLSEFIFDARLGKKRCVCIIHGKGMHNPKGTAVLKSMVHHWLSQSPEILALATAQAKDGGAGALYVLIKQH